MGRGEIIRGDNVRGKILICALALGETQALFVLGLGADCCIKARALAKGVTYDFAILPPHIKRAVAHATRTGPKLLTERRPVRWQRPGGTSGYK